MMMNDGQTNCFVQHLLVENRRNKHPHHEVSIVCGGDRLRLQTLLDPDGGKEGDGIMEAVVIDDQCSLNKLFQIDECSGYLMGPKVDYLCS